MTLIVRHLTVQSSYKINIPKRLIVPSSNLTIGSNIGQGKHNFLSSTVDPLLSRPLWPRQSHKLAG